MPQHALAPAPFPRLRTLLKNLRPRKEPIDLAIGAPRTGLPPFLKPILKDAPEEYALYPPSRGTPELRAAIAAWLRRRFALPPSLLNEEEHIVILSGTREGLFSIIPALQSLPDKAERSHILIPDPSYHAYAAAALYAGLTPIFLPLERQNGFLPDFESLTYPLLSKSLALYLCSPANPQGAVASLDWLRALIRRAREAGLFLLLDECYSEIYQSARPPSGLEAALHEGASLDNLVVFNSLSKRSGAPGLRSGFAAGDPALMTAFRRLRESGGAQVPLPLQRASAALWNDDQHVEKNRAFYQNNIRAAEEILGDSFDLSPPEGGFFLWLRVGDGEKAARDLWEKAGVRVMPGAYLTQEAEAANPAAPFIRVALVEEEARLREALARMARTLEGSP